MNYKNHILFIFIFFFSAFSYFAQDTVKVRNWKLKGYVTSMPSVFFTDIKKDWLTDNIFHNRLNFTWSPFQSLTSEIDLRNRIIYGERIKTISGYKEQFNNDGGVVDATENILSSKSAIFNSSVDRAFIKFTKGKFDITAGRQRVNWGQTFIWNPNDIFNAYSFFDFDYSEKQGSDALRIQFYPSAVSVVEAAVKLDSAGKLTSGALWKFNKWNYDFQLIGGMVNEQDYIAGLGWSGNIKSISLRGEASYFHPKNNFKDTTGTVATTIGVDYTFSNLAFLQVEFLYNTLTESSQNLNITQFSNLALSSKALSFTEYNIFAQFSYPVTPLFKTSIAAIYYPKINGFFAGPSFDYSIRDDMDISFIVQGFSGEFKTIPGSDVKQRQGLVMSFIRLRWNF